MTEVNHKLIISEDVAGMRLDQAIATLLSQYSRARIQQWIKAGDLTVDGKVLKPKDKVQLDQHVQIQAILIPEETWEPENIPLAIIYEDDDILVLNKPAGLVVHPAVGNRNSTLLNALIHHAPSLAELPRAGIIHRLDKDTTGLMVVTKTLISHNYLVDQMQQRLIKRQYQTIVVGTVIAGGTINKPLGRHPTRRTHMAVIDDGKPAVTHYRVKTRFRAHTHLEVQLETGRTHQIRVHLSHAKLPIVGDQTYNPRLLIPPKCTEQLNTTLLNFKRQALHASNLALTHPTTGEEMSWEAPLPGDMQDLLQALEADTISYTS